MISLTFVVVAILSAFVGAMHWGTNEFFSQQIVEVRRCIQNLATIVQVSL